MAFNKDIHHRKSIRLRGYDYSQPGAYFITICTHQRQSLFGDIVDGVMMLNTAGNIAYSEWKNISGMRHDVSLCEFVIMPNHMHGIINVGAHCMRPMNDDIRPVSDGQKSGRVQRALRLATSCADTNRQLQNAYGICAGITANPSGNVITTNTSFVTIRHIQILSNTSTAIRKNGRMIFIAQKSFKEERHHE